MHKEEPIGKIIHYYPKAHAAIVRVERGAFHIGDTLHIVGHGDDIHFLVESIEKDHRPIPEAQKGQLVGVKLPLRAHEKAEVRLVITEDHEIATTWA